MKSSRCRILHTAAILGAVMTTDAALPQCEDSLSRASVTCVAMNGHTESQWPKKYGAPEGTDCNAIPLPTADPKFPYWRECLRTVRFSFGWEYTGVDDATLVSIHREIQNNLGEYPEERVAMARKYDCIWNVQHLHVKRVLDFRLYHIITMMSHIMLFSFCF